MPQKLPPSHFGCSSPYSLSYGGRLRAVDPEHDLVLRDFIRAFRNAVARVCTVFESMSIDPEARALVYGIVWPKKLPPDLKEHPLFVSILARDAAAKAEKQPDHERNLGSPNQSWRAVFGTPRKTGPEVYVLDTFGEILPSAAAFRAAFEAALSPFPAESTKEQVLRDAVGKMKSFFSARENARELALQRDSTLHVLQERAPVFFGKLTALFEDARHWQRACRIWNDLRKALAAELVTAGSKTRDAWSAVNATQRAVMTDLARTIPEWNGVLPLREATAGAVRPDLAARFHQSLPAVLPELKPEDISRRLGRPGPSTILGKEPHLITTLLSYYNEQFQVFTDEELSELQSVEAHGLRRVAQGWIDSAKSKDSRHKALHNFFQKDVREFCIAIRPVKTVERNADTESWPLLSEGDFWTLNSEVPTRHANEIGVTITLPPFLRGEELSPKCSFACTIRGNVPFSKGNKIESLDIKNGMVQFRPNMVMHHPAETYVKPQAIRLREVDGRLFTDIAATQMTRVEREATVTKDFAANVNPRERVLIMHYLPGGSRLCTLSLFERIEEAPGWRLLQVTESRPRSDAGAYENGKRVRNRTRNSGPFIIIEDEAFRFRLSHLETKKQAATEGNSPDRNESVLATAGRQRTALGRTHYKQVAARIARIAYENRCGYILVGGGGRLITRGGMVHPTGNFLTMPSASLRTGCGSLLTALRKHGVTPLFTSGKVASIWMKGFVAGHRDAVARGSAFHVTRRQKQRPDTESSESDRGIRTLMRSPDGTTTCPFPLNAAWAILFGYFDKAFSELAKKVLASE